MDYFSTKEKHREFAVILTLRPDCSQENGLTDPTVFSARGTRGRRLPSFDARDKRQFGPVFEDGREESLNAKPPASLLDKQ